MAIACPDRRSSTGDSAEQVRYDAGDRADLGAITGDGVIRIQQVVTTEGARLPLSCDAPDSQRGCRYAPGVVCHRAHYDCDEVTCSSAHAASNHIRPAGAYALESSFSKR